MFVVLVKTTDVLINTINSGFLYHFCINTSVILTVQQLLLVQFHRIRVNNYLLLKTYLDCSNLYMKYYWVWFGILHILRIGYSVSQYLMVYGLSYVLSSNPAKVDFDFHHFWVGKLTITQVLGSIYLTGNLHLTSPSFSPICFASCGQYIYMKLYHASRNSSLYYLLF